MFSNTSLQPKKELLYWQTTSCSRHVTPRTRKKFSKKISWLRYCLVSETGKNYKAFILTLLAIFPIIIIYQKLRSTVNGNAVLISFCDKFMNSKVQQCVSKVLLSILLSFKTKCWKMALITKLTNFTIAMIRGCVINCRDLELLKIQYELVKVWKTTAKQ